jgi:hypothetical protein
VSSFGWLLDLFPAESATPAPKGVATGVAKAVAAHGGTRTPADEVPHLPHLPHPESSEAANDADPPDDLAEQLTERAAILEYDARIDRAKADVVAVRIAQCSTCRHWTADPLGGGGIGTCETGADSESWSAHDRRPLSAWPNAPRHCAGWEAAHG